MIPVLLVLGLALGRWWRTCAALAAVAWPVLLVATDVMEIEPALLAASLLAVVNTGVGVLVNRTVAALLRSMRTASSTA